MTVGNFAGGGGALNGFMDDFYFSNTVLSASDISFYSQNTITTPIPEPGALVLVVGGVMLMCTRRR